MAVLNSDLVQTLIGTEPRPSIHLPKAELGGGWRGGESNKTLLKSLLHGIALLGEYGKQKTMGWYISREELDGHVAGGIPG